MNMPFKLFTKEELSEIEKMTKYPRCISSSNVLACNCMISIIGFACKIIGGSLKFYKLQDIGTLITIFAMTFLCLYLFTRHPISEKNTIYRYDIKTMLGLYSFKGIEDYLYSKVFYILAEEDISIREILDSIKDKDAGQVDNDKLIEVINKHKSEFKFGRRWICHLVYEYGSRFCKYDQTAQDNALIFSNWDSFIHIVAAIFYLQIVYDADTKDERETG